MIEEQLRKLIEDGLAQPDSEPKLFRYPTGYSLTAPLTSYNTVSIENNSVNSPEVGKCHAELESSLR